LSRCVLLIGLSTFILWRMRAHLQFFTSYNLIVALYGLIDGTARHSSHASVHDSRARSRAFPVTYRWIGIKDSSFLPYFLFIFVRASRHHLLYARICISLCRATRRQHHRDTPQPRYIIIFNNNLRSTYLECKRRDGPSTVPDPFSILSFVTVRLLPFLPVRRLKLHRHATIVRNKRLSELSIAPDDSLMIILIVIWDRMWS